MIESEESQQYKIGEAARLLEVKPYVLRFWETEFPKLEPIRTASGQRMYTEENMTLLRRIKALLYGEGLTIEGARKRIGGEEQHSVDLEFLHEVAAELEHILDHLRGDVRVSHEE